MRPSHHMIKFNSQNHINFIKYMSSPVLVCKLVLLQTIVTIVPQDVQILKYIEDWSF